MRERESCIERGLIREEDFRGLLLRGLIGERGSLERAELFREQVYERRELIREGAY